MKLEDLIPKAEGVSMVAVPEHDGTWQVYIVNEKDGPIDTLMLTSRGYSLQSSEPVQTSTIRRRLPDLDPQRALKVEMIPADVAKLSNEFWLSYFHDGKMYDKKYIFLEGVLDPELAVDVPVLAKKGVIIK